jgi:hypothetical protein
VSGRQAAEPLPCQAPGMAFDLHRADGEVIRYEDGARFSFTATGHLVVYDTRGNKTLYSHHSWDRIEEPVPPPRT